eukprot:CAMPEP_0194493058 /NCGR_PEP_ID=MMETSP0253-20130528/11385_1 /TAXON_ID=2966 /ORGANISM="Noctiluca scintillans" /LENGTH=653 /DNA_ID=CAMNT_0039333995 /DNA_START=39 /DNA_END=2000 /DNA_ORIENTATION=-
MDVEWPITEITSIVRGSHWNRCDRTFPLFRRAVLLSPKETLERKGTDAEDCWLFLFEFCALKRAYKRQILECMAVLIEVKSWESALSRSVTLKSKAQALPEDVQAALAMESPVIMSTLTPQQAEKLRGAPPPPDMRKDEVFKSIKMFQAADKIHEGMIKEDAADEMPFAEPVDKKRAIYVEDTAVAREFRDSIESVMDIMDRRSFENDAVTCFCALRRACLHVAQCPQGPDVFARDSEHAGAVISFLIDFTKRHHRIRIKQICEVVNLLLSCPAWVAALDVSPMLRDRIRSELPEEIQAAFALQNRHLEASVTDRARTKAKDITDASLRQARKVAGDMHSIRHSIWIQPSSPEPPLDSVEEENSGVEPELSDAPKGAHEDKYQAIRDQAKATGAKATELTKEYGPKALEGMKGAAKQGWRVGDQARKKLEWRQGATPDGKKYYYNVRTKKTQWEKPKELIGGEEQNSTRDFARGDKVEVYSNSNQVWCSGVVEKVNPDTVNVAYRPPGAPADQWARKELSKAHETLRRAGDRESAKESARGSATAPSPEIKRWTSEESAAYESFFQAGGEPGKVAGYLSKSGLPRKALKEIWTVANPRMNSLLEKEEFFMCCRLTGHCQAMGEDVIVAEGGRPLRKLLQANCKVPPPALAQFH